MTPCISPLWTKTGVHQKLPANGLHISLLTSIRQFTTPTQIIVIYHLVTLSVKKSGILVCKRWSNLVGSYCCKGSSFDSSLMSLLIALFCIQQYDLSTE